jgi:hypothetical protein
MTFRNRLSDVRIARDRESSGMLSRLIMPMSEQRWNEDITWRKQMPCHVRPKKRWEILSLP